jgi:hypothetical protein
LILQGIGNTSVISLFKLNSGYEYCFILPKDVIWADIVLGAGKELNTNINKDICIIEIGNQKKYKITTKDLNKSGIKNGIYIYTICQKTGKQSTIENRGKVVLKIKSLENNSPFFFFLRIAHPKKIPRNLFDF